MDTLTCARRHLQTLGPHQRKQETAKHLEMCIAEVDQLRAKLAATTKRAQMLEALTEADRLMGHDDDFTELREKWAHLWPVAR